MTVLSKSNNKEVSSLLGTRNHGQVYARLSNLLGKDADIFAIPEISRGRDGQGKWSVKARLSKDSITSFPQLSAEEKDAASDYLEDKKDIIFAKLNKDKEFRSITNELFLIPSADSLKIIKSEGELKVVLTEWAYQSSMVTSQVDPVMMTIRRPRTNTAKVVLDFFYTDGSKAENKTFYLEYKERNIKYKSNQEGKYNRGRCLLNSNFSVFERFENEEVNIHNFTVSQGAEYSVTFPRLVTGTLKVINQKNEAISDIEISIETNDNEIKTLQTDKLGKINLDNLEVGKEITLKEETNPQNSATYTIVKEKNEFQLIIKQLILVQGTVTVLDENNEICLNYPILIDHAGEKTKHSTARNGIINLDPLVVDKQLKIIDGKNPKNVLEHIIIDGDNKLILKIEIPKAKVFNVQVVKSTFYFPFISKKRNLENIVVDFIDKNGEKITRTTNKQGYCQDLPEDEFDNGQKVKTILHIVKKDKKGNKKEKLVTKKFTFKNSI